jgi:hypothetical protein
MQHASWDEVIRVGLRHPPEGDVAALVADLGNFVGQDSRFVRGDGVNQTDLVDFAGGPKPTKP